MTSNTPLQIDTVKASSFLDSPTIEIRVGGEAGRSFFIHQDLLTSQSLFFANALNTEVPSKDDEESDIESFEVVPRQEADHGIIPIPDDEPESAKRIIHLPTDEPNIFAAWVQLIYNNTLPADTDPPKPILPANASEAAKTQADDNHQQAVEAHVLSLHLTLSKLYVLGIALQDLEAKKAVSAAFMTSCVHVRTDGFSHYAVTEAITVIYAGTVVGDPLRQFLVDCYVFRGGAAWADDEADVYPADFLLDVVRGMLRERARPVDTKTRDTKTRDTKTRDTKTRDTKTRDTKRYLEGMTVGPGS